MTKARDLANIISGGFTADDIPNLDASKIVSGDIASARLSLATETKPTVSSVSPTVISNDATNITITGQDFTAIPRVDIINTATGIWYSANTVTHNSATQLTVNVSLPVDAGTYRIRVENPDGLAGLSGANFLTVSDAPTWSTGAGSLGTFAGNLNGAVATVSASGDTIVYSEVTNVLTNASLANCSLNSSTGAITSSDFDGSSTSARTHTFTIRATDAQGQTSDREFSLTSSYFTGTAYYLVVAGGGSGGNERGGGGGAGGYRTNYGGSAYTLAQGVTYTVTVGNGGASRATTNLGRGYSGQDSSFTGSNITDITSAGGGGGGGTNNQTGGHGGSGGGSMDGNTVGNGNSPTTSPSQGNNGGSSAGSSPNYGSGGGGGSGATGVTGTSTKGGNGGVGTLNAITGSSIYYAGGGGGGVYNGHTVIGIGQHGGGNGGSGNDSGVSGEQLPATNGTANTGGGGGGAQRYGSSSSVSGAGGSGVVILRMVTADYNAKTGITGTYTATADGSDTVVKWTASGNISF